MNQDGSNDRTHHSCLLLTHSLRAQSQYSLNLTATYRNFGPIYIFPQANAAHFAMNGIKIANAYMQ